MTPTDFRISWLCPAEYLKTNWLNWMQKHIFWSTAASNFYDKRKEIFILQITETADLNLI